MRTSKAISTISFNTPEYLLLKLEELVNSKIISTWHFIPHKGENDECAKKDHSHLYIEPAKLIQTDELIEHFKEIDPGNNKPLTCLPFRTSQFDTWYLYGIHDKDYLASLVKQTTKKKFHYTYEDVQTSNPDELYRAVSEIDLGELAPINMLKKALKSGASFADLVGTGQVPLQQIANYEHAFVLLRGVGKL
jgi:hypothetical protein